MVAVLLIGGAARAELTIRADAETQLQAGAYLMGQDGIFKLRKSVGKEALIIETAPGLSQRLLALVESRGSPAAVVLPVKTSNGEDDAASTILVPRYALDASDATVPVLCWDLARVRSAKVAARFISPQGHACGGLVPRLLRLFVEQDGFSMRHPYYVGFHSPTKGPAVAYLDDDTFNSLLDELQRAYPNLKRDELDACGGWSRARNDAVMVLMVAAAATVMLALRYRRSKARSS